MTEKRSFWFEYFSFRWLVTCLTSCQVRQTWTTRSVRSVLTPCWTTLTHSSTSQRTNARITSKSILIDCSHTHTQAYKAYCATVCILWMIYVPCDDVQSWSISISDCKCLLSVCIQSRLIYRTICFQAVPGATVKFTGGGRGNPAVWAAAAERGGGNSSGGTGGSGGAEGYCGWRPGPVQGSLPAARCRGAPVSDPVHSWRKQVLIG